MLGFLREKPVSYVIARKYYLLGTRKCPVGRT